MAEQTIIMFDIPSAAIGLMGTKTVSESSQGAIDNQGISLLELKTFCMLNGPIIKTATGEVVGYVGAWGKKKAATVFAMGENDWLVLIGVENDPEEVAALFEDWQTAAVRIFEKYQAVEARVALDELQL